MKQSPRTAMQNAYPPNRTETASTFLLTGQTTVIKEQITTSGKRASANTGWRVKTMQESAAPAADCGRMPAYAGPKRMQKVPITQRGDMVVYVAGFPAIYGKQPLFFRDEIFLACASVPWAKNYRP